MMDDELHVRLTNGFGATSRQPFVAMQVGDLKPVQMSPTEARDLALNIVSCAEAAEQDAFFLGYLMTDVGMTLEQAGQVILAFRSARDAIRRKGDDK